MKTERVIARDLALGDVVRVFDGPFGDAVVRRFDPDGVAVFRPYATTADFSYTGGVIPYVGIEEFWLLLTTTVERLQKGGEKR